MQFIGLLWFIIIIASAWALCHTRSMYLFTYSRALNLGIDIRSGLNQSIENNIMLSFTPSWQVHSQDFKLCNVHLCAMYIICPVI